MVLPYISETGLFLSLLAVMVFVTSWLAAAASIHRRRCAAVPVRIHVAGSRGKTTTARLIGAALRAAGKRVLVKTTGTDPILIAPDGSESPWRRWTPPGISEQIRFFRHANRIGADAVVLESMAIQPEYIWASEHYLVRATHTVITNVRPDHAEEVGGHPLAAAQALSLVIPRNGRLYISDEAAVEPVLERVREAGLCERLAIVPVGGLAHDEANQALALAVCADIGVDREAAFAGFDTAGTDPGAFAIIPWRLNGRELLFANAFSCNDPASLAQLWQEAGKAAENAVILLNTREDRPERTRAMLSALANLKPSPRQIQVRGFVPRRWIRQAGLADDRVVRLRTGDPEKALQILADTAGEGGVIWGVGNYSALAAPLSG